MIHTMKMPIPQSLAKLSLLLCFSLLAWSGLSAHQPGSSSLVLKVDETGALSGEFHVADVDLESITLMLQDRLERAQEGSLTGVTRISATGLGWVRISNDGQSLQIVPGAPVPVDDEGRKHTMIPFSAGSVGGENLLVEFDEYFQFDPQHKVVTSLETAAETKVGILMLDEPYWTVSLREPGAWGQFVKFTWEGVWHIWIGIDHILFLIALLLPSVLKFENGSWVPVPGFKDAFYNVFKVVTAFTIAHSVTLTLASLDIVTLPSKFVESVIALSVVLAALNNIYPIVQKKTWTVAFGFGLVHGFGFANVLADLQLPSGTLAIALLSFNIGVELGQLAIVAVYFPIIYYLRDHAYYQPVKLKAGSAIIALIAAAWIVDRVFELEFMPF
jgi:hypothetical protein